METTQVSNNSHKKDTEYIKSSYASSVGEPPVDKFKFIYWMVFYWGIITHLPWDIIITLTPYWHAKLSEEDDPYSNELTDEQKDYLSYLTLAVMIPSTIIIIAYIFIGHLFNIHNEVVISLSGIVLSFFVVMALALLDTSEWIGAFMLVNLILTMILNSFSAYFRACTMKHLGKFPLDYLGSLQVGICIGGLLPVTVNIIILSVPDVDMEVAGFCVFTFGCACCVFCLVSFFFVEKNSFYQYYSSLDKINPNDCEGETGTGSEKITKDLFKKFFNISWIYMLTCIFLGIGTHAVHPAVTSLIEPENSNGSDWHEVYFDQVMCFVVFNMLQCLGSVVCSYLKNIDGTTRKAQIISCAVSAVRLIFVPLIMMCNVAPENRDTEIYIDSEYVFLGMMIVFAFTDGYLKTQIMMYGPKIAQDPMEQDSLASVLVAILNTGYSVGSVVGILIISIL